MKKNIKKAAIVALSTIGIFSAVPTVFCSGSETENFDLKNEGAGIAEKPQLNNFFMKSVGKYFTSADDFLKLAMVNKKFRFLPEKYKFNPVGYDPKMFDDIYTFYVRPGQEEFVSTFPNWLYILAELNTGLPINNKITTITP